MRIAILGAGWYGCHMASTLIQFGHSVEIFEKTNSIFSGASKKNQNRLHKGYHYPRDFETRLQSSEGFDWFKEHYPGLIKDIKNNYYCIAKDKSLLDMRTYLQVMDASNLSYNRIEVPCITLRNVEGVIQVDEMLIRNDLALKYFSKLLAPYLRLNQPVNFENIEERYKFSAKYDYVIDCSWKAADKFTGLDIYFEPCIYFYFQKKIDLPFALTIMDGKFFSLYPYIENLYTLTSVEYTPISKCLTYDKALSDIESITRQLINKKREKFVELTEIYYPDFSKHFEYQGYECSIKTKINTGSDFRGSILEVDGNFISVYSGKIDTIHVIEKKILEVFHENYDVGI